ncbi:MAG: hypothetical protein OEU32_07980 [Acidimicrobiia bacterium]|nr:hypothetical protein [Acidimicrobiia bacterium]
MTITDFNGPLEMLGSHAGINIIDPSTVLSRLWYFDGKFLRAEGFRRDQEYVRSLVALSNQATGHGVVHGYDVELAGGDELRVEGGLALARSGRVVYLPQTVDLSIAQLINRSTGRIDPGESEPGGVSEFAACPPDEPADPDLPIAPRPLYVLTVAAAEALCGDEERFGQLCEDACATETDRSVAVEGVCFRVLELNLALPSSTLVPFGLEHLRSQVASAWYERERSDVPSMISGAGLRSPVWCHGADGVGGEQVPLAVFDRAGQVTSWVDMWTARRELIETSPHRYWGWRFAMRPLDVFLAQVLQFQCELLALGGGGADPGGDPCAEERATLVAAEALLADVAARESEAMARLGAAGDFPVAMAKGLDQIEVVRGKISETLLGGSGLSNGSLLLDGGIIELPSGGYLPTRLDHDLEAQVRAYMGPGVDLRFCAVRADFIPEALQEAQHMERISLTQGIDDPGNLEEVDILVPDGRVDDSTTTTSGEFEGALRFLPRRMVVDDTVVTGSALALAMVARDQVQDGWSWSVAAHGEAPQQLAVSNLMQGIVSDVREEAATAATVDMMKVHIEPDADHEAALHDNGFRQRANRERHLAEQRHEASMLSAFGPAVGGFAQLPDRALRRDEKRPISLWFDVETDRDLREVPIGGRAGLRLRFSVYSRAKEEPVVLDFQVTGGLVVKDKHTQSLPGGAQVVAITTTSVDGFVDPLFIGGSLTIDLAPQPFSGLDLDWRVGVSSQGARILDVQPTIKRLGARASFDDIGSPRLVRGFFDIIVSGQSALDTDEWTAVIEAVDESRVLMRFADLDLTESPGALALGTPGRDLGEAAIQVIGTELAIRGRELGFTSFARGRLFPAEPETTRTIHPTTDWVMFHRRRNKVCAMTRPDRPVGIRRHQWYHVVLKDGADLATLAKLGGRWEKSGRLSRDIDFIQVHDAVDDLGFEPVALLEFVEQSDALHSSLVELRSAWKAKARGDILLAGVVGENPGGDGATIATGRLMTTISSIADLVDTTGVTTDVLAEIPPEFQTGGIDGAIFTAGVARPKVTTECALLYRLDRAQRAQLAKGLAGAGEVTQKDIENVLQKLDIPIDSFVVRFNGPDIENKDAVLTWWGQGQTAAFFDMAFSSEVSSSELLKAEWIERVSTLDGLLGIESFQIMADVTPAFDECSVLAFIVPSIVVQ